MFNYINTFDNDYKEIDSISPQQPDASFSWMPEKSNILWLKLNPRFYLFPTLKPSSIFFQGDLSLTI